MSKAVAQPGFLARIVNDNAQEIKGKVAAIYILLGIANVVLWGITFLASRTVPRTARYRPAGLYPRFASRRGCRPYSRG